MDESENNAKSPSQPYLRGEEPWAVSEATMSQVLQANEEQLIGETSKPSIQELPGTSQEATANDMVASSSVDWNNFMCPICLDTLKNTRITKECSHRFCKDCIITALRRGNKECPVCRRKLISKRSLDSDPQFDELIMKMYSRSNEKNVSEEKALSRKRCKTQQAADVIIEKGKEIDAINSVHPGEKKLIESDTGWEGNHDSLPCNNTSTHSSYKAGPSNKQAKISGLEDDTMTYDAVANEATEHESKLHPTLRGKDDPAPPRIKKTSGKHKKQRN